MSKKELSQKEIGKRLNDLRKKLGYTREQMAKMLDEKSGTFGNYLSGTRDLPTSLLVKLKDRFNVNLNWLLTGEGPMFNDELEVVKSDTDEIVKLPYYKDNFVSAGYGIDNVGSNPVIVSFSKELLKTIARTNIDRGISLVLVFGNSMEPTIPEKSIAIVLDYRVESFLREGSIYVVKYDGEEFIKRVFRDPVNKVLKLISDNDDYPAIEVVGEDSDRFQILGRVIGYITGV